MNDKEVLSGLEQIRAMLEVVEKFSCRYELIEISEHVYRIFDLVLSSTLFETFLFLLLKTDDMTIAPIKIEGLRVFTLLSNGLTLFNHAAPTKAITNQANTVFDKLKEKLLNQDFIMRLIALTGSYCKELREQALLFVGFLCRNNVDIYALLFEHDLVSKILENIFQAQHLSTLQFISWSLFIISKKCLDPLKAHTPKALAYADRIFKSFFGLFERGQNEITVCCLFALGYILHLIPLSDLSVTAVQHICYHMSSTSPMIQHAAISAARITFKFSRVHTPAFVQNFNVVNLLVNTLEKTQDEKVQVLCLQAVQELASSGFQMHLVDPALFNCLLRMVGSSSTHQACTALEVVKAIAETSTYNAQLLINHGFVKTLFSCFLSFRSLGDGVVDKVFDLHLSESSSLRSSPQQQSQHEVPFYNFYYITACCQTLERFLLALQDKK